MGRRLLQTCALVALACWLVLGAAPRVGRADDRKDPPKGATPFFVALPEDQRPPGYDDLVERLRERPRTEDVVIGTLDERSLRTRRGPLTLSVRVFDREWIGEPLFNRRSGVRRVRAFASPCGLDSDPTVLTLVDRRGDAPPLALLVAHRAGRTLDVRSTGQTDVAGRLMYAAVLVRELPVVPDEIPGARPRHIVPPEWRPWSWRDRGDCFELLVGYTQDVLRGVGGDTDEIRLDVGQAVVRTECIFANSDIQTSLNVVAVLPTGIEERNELGNHIGLENLLITAMDSEVLKIARYCLRADLVTLFAESGQRAGQANVWRDPLVNFATQAYSVVVQFDAAWSDALAHELGHNMGCAHDPPNTTLGGLYAYSYGHAWPAASGGQTQGTTMTYANTRLLVYSNPAVTYPLGAASGTPCGTVDHDNARTIRRNRIRIANWGNQLPRPW